MMELRSRNNNQGIPHLQCVTARFIPRNEPPKRKRDFRFEVIQVCQGPKWFVWPTPHKPDEKNEGDESKVADQENNQNCPEQNDIGPTEPMQMMLNEHRQTFTVSPDTNITNGALTPVTATNQTNTQTPMSEPTTRRIAFKPTLLKSEPISTSAPSTTFKILSIAKKWNDSLSESDDEDYLDTQMAEECDQMTLGSSLPPQSSCHFCNCRFSH